MMVYLEVLFVSLYFPLDKAVKRSPSMQEMTRHKWGKGEAGMEGSPLLPGDRKSSK